jgi:hypothetical protein
VDNYLVFECNEPVDEFTGSIESYDASGRLIHRDTGTTRRRKPTLNSYHCIGAVRAKDETAAARAVVGVTRRLTKLAVVPAVFIDFTDEADDVEEERPQLNP